MGPMVVPFSASEHAGPRCLKGMGPSCLGTTVDSENPKP